MKKAILLLLTAAFGIAANAQGSNFMISYPVGFAVGDLHKYTSNVSFRGISLEFNKMTSHESSAGLEVGWNVFYQPVAKQAYHDGTAAISGVQFRYTNAVPMVVGTKYYVQSSNKAIHPYIGMGLGTTYVDRTTSFGLYSIVNDSWQFLIRPEIGLDIKFNKNESFFIGGKYFWNFNNSSLDGQSWLSANIGLRMSSF
jgi:outer membrane protein W